MLGRYVQRWEPPTGGGSALAGRPVDAAIFVNPLTRVQRTVLGDILGCLVLSVDDLALQQDPVAASAEG